MTWISKIICTGWAFVLIGIVPHAAYAQSTPPGYSWCSNESGSCSFSGWKLMSYGNENKFVYQWFQNSVACNSTAFGTDPDPGYGKVCAASAAWGTPIPSGYQTCSSEYNTCSFSGTQLVGFGYDGYYVYKAFTNGVSCTAGSFGVDPANGYTKSCIVPASGSGLVSINAKLGEPNRVLIGLGSGNTITAMNQQGIKPDIIDTYLVGVGSSSWINYSSPIGTYITYVAAADKAAGAIPMFTLYQMAQNGDGNISGINKSSFMNSYWSQVRLMFQMLGNYGKPALVNLEPDFWGYVEAQAPNHDPTQLGAVVSTQSECSSVPNTAAGIAQCMYNMAHRYAPATLIGYPASFFGESASDVAAFMQKVGAQNGDFIVAQTSDRDAGCMEVQSPPTECQGRGNGPFYWDENNNSSPDFLQSQQTWNAYKNGLGNNLPILWWQTPMGVPSSSPGGYNQHYRDDHVDYMLKNAWQYGNMHSFAMVFSSGASSQTTISTDNGQFKNLLSKYLSAGGDGIQ